MYWAHTVSTLSTTGWVQNDGSHFLYSPHREYSFNHRLKLMSTPLTWRGWTPLYAKFIVNTVDKTQKKKVTHDQEKIEIKMLSHKRWGKNKIAIMDLLINPTRENPVFFPRSPTHGTKRKAPAFWSRLMESILSKISASTPRIWRPHAGLRECPCQRGRQSSASSALTKAWITERCPPPRAQEQLWKSCVKVPKPPRQKMSLTISPSCSLMRP